MAKPSIDELSQITRRIYISSHRTSTNRELLQNAGITHVLSILGQGTEEHADAFTYKLVKHIEDDANHEQSRKLYESFFDNSTFVHECLSSADTKILIHW